MGLSAPMALGSPAARIGGLIQKVEKLRPGKGRGLPRPRSGAGLRRLISQPFPKDSFMRKGTDHPQTLLGGLSGLDCITDEGFINVKDIPVQLS